MKIGDAHILALSPTVASSVWVGAVQEITTGGWSNGDGIFPERYDGSPDGVKETISEEGRVDARTSPGRIDG